MSDKVIEKTLERLRNDLAFAAPEIWLVHVERRMHELADALDDSDAESIDGEVQLAYSHSAGTVIEVYLGEGMLEDAQKWVDRKVRIIAI